MEPNQWEMFIKYWIDESKIINVGNMSNARGNLKRLLKYGQGGKAHVEALLVRIIWKLIMIVFDFIVWFNCTRWVH
jgi:hypothetical protein